MRLKRLAIAFAALSILLIAAGIFVLQSSWFYDKVRQRIVSTLADATGGRVAISSFTFDWKHLRAEVRGLTLAGTEPAGKPPLLRADSVAVGLKIVSLLKRDVDIQYLEVRHPQVYLIIFPDGRTNVPQPRVKRAGNPMEDILKLAIGRFRLDNGLFEVESQSKTPFDLRGQDLRAALAYDRAGPRYRGQVSAGQVDFRGNSYRLAAEVSFEKDRIALTSARVVTGDSSVEASGAVENLAAPHAQLRFEAAVSAADADRILHTKLVDRGSARASGTARWDGGAKYSLDGVFRASNLDYRGAYIQLRGFRAEGSFSADPEDVSLKSLRFSGTAPGMPVSGQVAAVGLRGSDLTLRGIDLQVLGGRVRAEGSIRDLERFSVSGEVSGIEARRAVSVYSTVTLPWNSLVSGTIKAEGLLQRRNELRASGDLTLAPASGSAPVHGHVTAAYDTRTGVLDLGQSSVSLPSSTAEFSGAIGRQLTVHLETHNLDDFLPALGTQAAALPVKLENGRAVFDGTITGSLQDPQAAGHLTASNFIYAGEKFASLDAGVTLNRGNAALRNATLSRDGLRAQFEGAVELHDWTVDDSSLIAGSGSVRNAPAADLAALLRIQTPVTGSVTAIAQVNGTLGSPIFKGDVSAAKGSILDEPFDSFSAHLDYSNRNLTASNAQLVAGPKQFQFNASYTHAPGNLASGSLHFQASSNDLPIESIAVVHRDRPDAAGVLHLAANGSIELVPAKAGEIGVRISDLHVDAAARDLKLGDEPLGNAHVTANSQNDILRAHADSDFAGSSIKADGQWKLEGDYPGSGTITFSRTDFARLRAWLPGGGGELADRFAGYAEGQIRFEGPALKPRETRGELRIPSLEVQAAAPQPGGASLKLTNSGPIVATLANSTVAIDSMRLVGHDTDLGVTGKILLDQKTSDLRVNGRVDLAIVHDFNPDFRASGIFTADATVRGPLDAPSVNGRTEFHNATFTVADLPNGLSNTNGVITFSGGRATIQSFSGETGGGKVQLFGFAAYENGQTIFRIHARVDQVRVRYPEGVSTIANASLNLTGSLERSMLGGTVTILRTGFNPQSDFSSLIAASAQPVQTPSVGTGFLGGLGFDIQINTAPDIEVQSSLAQDVQVDANLRLRGTFSNPALLGRINLTQGQIVFFGTRYTISQGSISFYNPVRVDPIFDLDLETKARGIDITLSITGPLNKLNLTPRSDPPLQFNEIVALLATGRTPTNDPTLLAQQSTAPQSWQQMGASALLGQAIANPVAGRLQRFFGVSRLRIDPSFSGTTTLGTPQTYLTLEQQVTPDITFTYATNVTSSNPQVVRIEWAFSKQWSVVALREENGMFGIDFFFKRRF